MFSLGGRVEVKKNKREAKNKRFRLVVNEADGIFYCYSILIEKLVANTNYYIVAKTKRNVKPIPSFNDDLKWVDSHAEF